MVVSVYRLVWIWNSPQFLTQLRNSRQCTRLWHRLFTEIYKASSPVICVMLKSEAKSAQSRKKTSSNGNLVLDSVRKKMTVDIKKKKKKKCKKPRNTIWKLIIQVKRATYFAEAFVLLLVCELHRASKWPYILLLFLFFIQSNWKLPFETKLHVLLSLRELLEGWKIFWPLSYKIKMKNPAIKETKIWS